MLVIVISLTLRHTTVRQRIVGILGFHLQVTVSKNGSLSLRRRPRREMARRHERTSAARVQIPRDATNRDSHQKERDENDHSAWTTQQTMHTAQVTVGNGGDHATVKTRWL